MICVAIQESNVERCIEMASSVELAEIRIDLCRFNEEEVAEVFSKSSAKLIATCRPVSMTTELQKTLLKRAIQSGASMVDIEVESTDEYIKEMVAFARKYGCKVIISYHNYNETPDIAKLRRIVELCFLNGADIAKIATQANTTQDAARLLSMYQTDQKILILGMGECGKITRVAANLLGAPFTFAATDPDSATAPGQLDLPSLKQIYSLMGL